jgi:type IV secretion system protein VirB10
MQLSAFLAMAAVAGALAGQDAAPEATPTKSFVVETGTRIPLSMVNSVSTKTTGEGDRVYLETSFPIAVNGKIVIPAGSYVDRKSVM